MSRVSSLRNRPNLWAESQFNNVTIIIIMIGQLADYPDKLTPTSEYFL